VLSTDFMQAHQTSREASVDLTRVEAVTSIIASQSLEPLEAFLYISKAVCVKAVA